MKKEREEREFRVLREQTNFRRIFEHFRPSVAAIIQPRGRVGQRFRRLKTAGDIGIRHSEATGN